MVGPQGGYDRLKAYIRLTLAESHGLLLANAGTSPPVLGGGEAEHH